MARIIAFRQGERQKGRPQPTEVECQWTVFHSRGRPLLQLDTFGSKHREKPGKQSQTFQLDERAAEELAGIIREVFGTDRVSGS